MGEVETALSAAPTRRSRIPANVWSGIRSRWRYRLTDPVPRSARVTGYRRHRPPLLSGLDRGVGQDESSQWAALAGSCRRPASLAPHGESHAPVPGVHGTARALGTHSARRSGWKVIRRRATVRSPAKLFH